MWFPIPTSSISILHFVARIFGRKLYNFALLNAEDSGKHQNCQAIFTLVNITHNFSKVRVGLPGGVFQQGNDIVKSAPFTLPNSNGKCQVYCMGIVGH